MRKVVFNSLLLGATVGFTVYAQIVLKWQVMQLDPAPTQWPSRLRWAAAFVMRPFVLSCFTAGFLAFLTWTAVLRETQLSRVYPFMGLSFILVAWLSSLFFGESLSAAKLIGTLLVVVGLVLASQG
ncbi:MAG TPA: EamA family transporter [Thermoanaerobaculia bacterium]|nr:EamA family transporter [Thermoanaerobaculia bacterium]